MVALQVATVAKIESILYVLCPLEDSNTSVKELQCVLLYCVRIMEMNISGW